MVQTFPCLSLRIYLIYLSIDKNSEEKQHDHRELTDADDDNDDDGKDFVCPPIPVLFDQQSLSDLIRDLSLSLRDDET